MKALGYQDHGNVSAEYQDHGNFSAEYQDHEMSARFQPKCFDRGRRRSLVRSTASAFSAFSGVKRFLLVFQTTLRTISETQFLKTWASREERRGASGLVA